MGNSLCMDGHFYTSIQYIPVNVTIPGEHEKSVLLKMALLYQHSINQNMLFPMALKDTSKRLSQLDWFM